METLKMTLEKELSIDCHTAYYPIAAVLSALIPELSHRCCTVLVRPLTCLCLASILLNLVGWFLYEYYLSPAVYNFGFVLLYISALLLLIKGGGHGSRYTKNNRRNRGVPRLSLPNLQFNKGHK